MNGQLRAIHGLDPISWWPPASGWWISGALIFLGIFLLIALIRHLIKYPPGSWHREAREAILELRKQSRQLTPKETAGRLSVLLRRIAMARFGRHGMASLSGQEWLEWLDRSDPNHFDWSGRGRLLLSLPYAPDDQSIDPRDIEVLITATQRLISVSKEDAAGRKAGRKAGRRKKLIGKLKNV
ncbi:MAG: DUF4381 domain-containing protein [Gammaproteobacteria bacterium]|nr:DUF4381 domain-containing protein [Gammaproteobacteria bacterium]